MLDKNYIAQLEKAYTLFGVPAGTSKIIIREKYKELSMKWHPDRNPASDATEKFQSLGAAYELLMDEKVAEYDEYTDEYTDEDFTETTFKNHATSHRFSDWSIVSSANSFNVSHPRFSPICDNIGFWLINSSSPCVVLPTYFNTDIRQKIKRSLYPLIDNQRFFKEVCSYNGDYDHEIIIYLASSPVIRGEMIRKICKIYTMPDEVISFIKDRMNVEFVVQSNPPNLCSWVIQSTGSHLFVSHPSLQGEKDNITFWNINEINRQITLPVNHSVLTHKKIKENLSRYISALNDNVVEITIQLPDDKNDTLEIIEHVATIYNIPESFEMQIKETVGNSFDRSQHFSSRV